MQHFTTTIPTMKELEEWMLRKMQVLFTAAMIAAFKELDEIILEQRDRERYRVKAECQDQLKIPQNNRLKIPQRDRSLSP